MTLNKNKGRNLLGLMELLPISWKKREDHGRMVEEVTQRKEMLPVHWKVSFHSTCLEKGSGKA